MQPWTTPLASARHVAFFLLDDVHFFVFRTLTILFIVVLLRAFLRHQAAAIALAVVVCAVAYSPHTSIFGGSIVVPLLVAGVSVSVILYVLLQWGLLAAIVLGLVWGWLGAAPLTLDATLWYAGRSFLVLAACIALAVYGFVVSLGGKPMFGRPLFEE